MKRKNPIMNLLSTEWEYLRDKRKIFLFYMFLFVIANLLTLLRPLVMGSVFNSIQTDILTEAGMWVIISRIWLLLAISIVFWIFHGTARVLETKTGFLVRRNYTNDMMNKVLSLPLSWHRDNHSGDTIDKINLSSKALEDFSQHYNFRLVGVVISLFGSMILLLTIDKTIAAFAFGVSIIAIFVTILIDRKLGKMYKKLSEFRNRVNATIFDYLSNIRTVITLRREDIVKQKVDENIMKAKPIFDKSTVFNETKWAFVSNIISLMIVIALSFKAYSDFAFTGVIMIGTLYMLSGYLWRIGDGFFKVANLYGSIVKNSARVENARPIIDAYDKLKKNEKVTPFPSDWKNLDIKKVRFNYRKDEEVVGIRNVNLSIERGKKIAIIGESGSGKSTVLSLLRGIYTPDKGELFCDGKKQNKGLLHLKNHTTLILQDPELFEATLRFNITMGRKINEEELREVVLITRLAQVLDNLPDGLDTDIKEKGVNLSGGEKQRLALARGLLSAKDSDILLLDEPTSSVDSINELKIYQRIFSNFRGKTIISTIHRLHLLEGFDYIYMMDNGKVIGEGNFRQLQNTKAFSKLWEEYNRSLKE